MCQAGCLHSCHVVEVGLISEPRMDLEGPRGKPWLLGRWQSLGGAYVTLSSLTEPQPHVCSAGVGGWLQGLSLLCGFGALDGPGPELMDVESPNGLLTQLSHHR